MKVWRALHEFADARSDALLVRQVPFTLKQPAARLMPPVVVNVDVPAEKLMPLVVPIERSDPGDVVPTPTFPSTIKPLVGAAML